MGTEVEGIRNEKIQKELKVLHDIKSVLSALLQLKKTSLLFHLEGY